MPNTKIKRDTHSLYVRAGGGLFRPRPTGIYFRRYTGPRAVALVDSTRSTCVDTATHPTLFLEDAAVHVSEINGTPFCRVSSGGRCEYWHHHGETQDINGNEIPTEKIWEDV